MYFRRRLMEWMNASIQTVMGTVLVLAPASLERPGMLVFQPNANVWIPALIAVGVMRLVALFINGHWKNGTPLLRMVGSMVGAGLFGSLAGVFMTTNTLQSIGFGTIVFVGLTVGELINSVYCAADVARRGNYV